MAMTPMGMVKVPGMGIEKALPELCERMIPTWPSMSHRGGLRVGMRYFAS